MGKVTKRELYRQLFHIFSGTMLGLLFYHGWITRLHLTLLFFALLFAFMVYLRIKLPGIHQMLTLMERKKNMKFFPGSGALYFVLGIALSPWLFPRDIATASILILAWSDGIASLIGPYGKFPYINPKKMWEGIIVAIIAGAVAASFVVPPLEAILAATLAMLVEGLDIKIKGWKIDDNPIVPLVAGIVISIVRVVRL